MIRIVGPRVFMDRLVRLDLPAVKLHGLEVAASGLHDAVTASLSHSPGATLDLPALPTGELRVCIAHAVAGDEAVIFATFDLVVAQEMGTAHLRPCPFLAPAATQHAETVAYAMAMPVGGAIGGDSP